MQLHSVARGCLAALCLFVCADARAAGPTSEDDAWGDLESGSHPLVLSEDGAWRVHPDASNVLHRARLDGAADESVVLPAAAPLRWPTAAPGREDLYGLACPADRDAKPIGSEAEPGLTDHPRVAISADSSRTALAGPPLWGRYERISVIDADTGALVQHLPGEGRTLPLRFIDDDRALFAAQAVLGATYEGDAAPSDLRFAIWDLHTSDLRNFVNRKPGDNFAREDFLADFSVRSRLVRMVQVGADRRVADRPTLRLRVRSADFGRCAIDRDVVEDVAASA